MGKRINYEQGRPAISKYQTKVYLDTSSNVIGWRELFNPNEGVTCQACTRRIKKGQYFFYHIETETKMHKPEDCKLW